jgi:hypothetical protein
LVTQVPGRSFILIHPANNAALELRGCIAPVLKLTGAGTGNGSHAACNKLLKLVDECIEREEVSLSVISGAEVVLIPQPVVPPLRELCMAA